MGLDMYLRASAYVSRNDYSQDEILENPLFAEIVKQFNVEDSIDKTGFAGISIDFPMGYWRKANQIHNWFVTFVQDGEDNCGQYYVGRDQLEDLAKTCQKVLADHSKAEELLPTGAGFFFGSTEYDEWYMQDINHTAERLDKILKDPALAKCDFYYQSSW